MHPTSSSSTKDRFASPWTFIPRSTTTDGRWMVKPPYFTISIVFTISHGKQHSRFINKLFFPFISLTFYLSTHLKLNWFSLVFFNKYLKSPALLSPFLQITIIRNLGFIFDSSVTFSKQISSLFSACNYHIRDLRRVRHTLDLKTASVVATSLVHSKFAAKTNISSPVTAKLPCSHSNWNPKTEHITPVLKAMHWLKIEEGII